MLPNKRSNKIAQAMPADLSTRFIDLLYHLRLVPFVAALREQIVGGNRAQSAGGVKFAVRQRFVFPAVADGIHDLPRGFHFVTADE